MIVIFLCCIIILFLIDFTELKNLNYGKEMTVSIGMFAIILIVGSLEVFKIQLINPVRILLYVFRDVLHISY